MGLGPTATADRVRRLERLKVISGYRAKIDYGSLGIGLRAITELRLSSQANYKLFEATLYDTPEVQAMYHVTGDVDYIILIACKDVPALDRLSVEQLARRGWGDRELDTNCPPRGRTLRLSTCRGVLLRSPTNSSVATGDFPVGTHASDLGTSASHIIGRYG